MKDLTDLRTIQALVTVAHEGNVSRAAELLHLTQPAVSLQLKRLAADTGLTLFRRSRAGLELTRDGHSLATKAENVVNAAKDFGLAAECLKGSASGKLRLGTIIDPDFVRLGALLSALSENAPELETELKHGMSGDVPGKIERGECDAGYFLGDIASFNERAAQRKKPRFACNTLARFTY